MRVGTFPAWLCKHFGGTYFSFFMIEHHAGVQRTVLPQLQYLSQPHFAVVGQKRIARHAPQTTHTGSPRPAISRALAGHIMHLKQNRELIHTNSSHESETTSVDQPLLQAYRPARGRRAVRPCASVIPRSLCTGEAYRPRE